MHLRSKFEYYDAHLDMKRSVNSWRKMLLDVLPADIHPGVKKVSEPKMRKIMDLMKIRIHFYSDMKNHTYFFIEPTYDNDFSQKLFKKLKQPNDVKVKILEGLKIQLKSLSDFTVNDVNKANSMFLYENAKIMGLKNEDVFSLLRFAVSGNPVGAPVGDICEIIGKEQVL